jgi:cytochrome c oxidase assembly protein subunit 15
MSPALHRLAVIATIVAFCVIVLGAFVRLSNAGLGCPDWPGCYGHVTWPQASHEVATANETFPERPVESHKAWKEMVHRYLAGFLVLLVALINVAAWKQGKQRGTPRLLATLILALILFQAALGMWTVTLKLLPVVVMGHLLGGLATFSLLLWLALRTRGPGYYQPGAALRKTRPWIATGLVVLLVQITLGGWTSANYSALACPDLPTCQGSLWPTADFSEGFRVQREIGVDYEGGVLDLAARVAIHQAHRIGAVVTLLMLMVVALRLMRTAVLQRSAAVLLLLVLAQFSLGVLNILLLLPLPNAVAHNGTAALLLAQMIWLMHRSTPQRS